MKLLKTKLLSHCRELFSSLALVLCVVSPPAFAQQIRADTSLSTLTTVNAVGLDTTIDGGDRIGNSLFHSFSEFSVPTNGSATFANPGTVTNIFGRVTGGSASTIDGLIETNNSANLFLINPAGLMFGPNAQLDIGGSFVGSTAESIRFTGNSEFSATNPTSLLPLTISVPIGLQLGTSSQDIRVQDTGYATFAPRPLTVDTSSSLNVDPGQTIALVGRNVFLDSGSLFAPAGHIELSGVRSGIVNVNLAATDFDYTNVAQFGNVELSSQSLVNASGIATGRNAFGLPTADPLALSSQGGSIRISGQQLVIQNDSKVVTQNYGNLSFGSIRLDANDTINLTEIGSRHYRNFYH